MALSLQENFKGYLFQYWKITDFTADINAKIINVRIALYKDRTARIDNPDNYVKKELKTIKVQDIDISNNLLAELYIAIKKEHLSSNYNENGDVIGTYNSNKFTSAEDIID